MSKKERPWTCVHDLFYFIFINETTIYCVCCKIALTYLVGDDMMHSSTSKGTAGLTDTVESTTWTAESGIADRLG